MNPAIVLAAVAWFRDHRPAHWSVEQHIQQPCVGMRGKQEFDLALAVAEYLKQRSGVNK